MRGYAQITGRLNYTKWSARLNIDLVNNPDLATQPKYAMPILILSMKNGWFTGKKLSDYIRPGSVDYINARRTVNGTDKASLIAGYARTWFSRLDSLGYGTGGTETTATATATATATTATTTTKSDAEAKKETKENITTNNTNAIDVSKGVLIEVDLGFNDSTDFTRYGFLLTDVRGSNDYPHTCKISGKQVRHLIAKTTKPTLKIIQNTSILQLAEQVASKINASVSFPDADILNKYYAIIKAEKNDYATLLKVAKENGLFVRSTNNSLKIETLKDTDKKIKLKKEALLTGSNWGDTANNSRLVIGSEQATEAQTAAITPTTTTPTTTGTTPTTSGLILPCKRGVLSQGYKPNEHEGLDIAATGQQAMFAVGAGSILKAGAEDTGLGNAVYLKLNDGRICVYGHCSSVSVKAGQAVTQGQTVARMGNTGNSTGEHLHFEIWKPGETSFTPGQSKSINPLTVLPDLKSNGIEVLGTGGVEEKKLIGDISTFSSAVVKGTDDVKPDPVRIGLLNIASKPDEEKGIGKGFEGQLNISSIIQPEIIGCEPGTIITVDTGVGFGEAITREYRISEITHTYNSNGVVSSVNIYLPVAVRVSKATATVSPTANAITNSTPIASTNNVVFTGTFAENPKKGDVIAGFTVTSPWGLRNVSGGSRNHKGVDVGMPNGTSLYCFGRPGDIIKVIERNQGNTGGGLYCYFETLGYTIYLMHCQKIYPGTYTIPANGQGIKVADSDNTGSSTGSHLHFGMSRKPDFNYIPPQRGLVFAAITGRLPQGTITK